MNKDDVNIELIRDYFAGKLDAKAMHALEKHALEDPFLAEAMEGFHLRPGDVPADLGDLQERLENRVYKKSFVLKDWLAAASVVLLLGIGSYFLWIRTGNKTQGLAKEIVQNAIVQQPVAANSDSQDLKARRQDSLSEILLANRSIKAKHTTKKGPEPRLSSGTSNDISVISRPANAETLSSQIVSRKPDDNSIAATLQGRVAGIATGPATRSLLILDSVTQRPLAAVSVNIPNSDFAALSNAEGYVHLPDTLKADMVSISAIGYARKIVAANNKVARLQPAAESLNDVVVVGYGKQEKQSLTGAVADLSAAKHNPSPVNIRLRGNAVSNHASPLILIDGNPDSLAAVSPQDVASINVLKDSKATALYGTRGVNGVILVTTKKADTNSISFRKSKMKIQVPGPQTGWDRFGDYVKTTVKNLDSAGVHGPVMLSFSINPDGRPANFKIIKGLSDQRNRQAIDILKNGPLWIYNAASHIGFYTIDF